jgi:hypothetical protein
LDSEKPHLFAQFLSRNEEKSEILNYLIYLTFQLYSTFNISMAVSQATTRATVTGQAPTQAAGTPAANRRGRGSRDAASAPRGTGRGGLRRVRTGRPNLPNSLTAPGSQLGYHRILQELMEFKAGHLIDDTHVFTE